MSNCKQCNTEFEWQDEDLKLFDKFGFEPTQYCFECQQKWRLTFRNERMLYHRKCDFSGEGIISVYSPDKPYKVYKNDVWHGDQWDALEVGQEVDFSRPFFDQMIELQLKVPRIAIIQAQCENSEYCNMCGWNKDCYLVFGGDCNENVLYGTLCMDNKDSLDLDFSNKNELCYMMGDVIGSYGCHFAFDSKNCKSSYFISDCSNCTECILCTNLSNKTYCINNEQLAKEEYFKQKEELINGKYSQQQDLFKKLLELRKQRIVKYSHIVNSQNCSGDYIKNSKNCHNVYDVSDSEDVRNVIFTTKAKDIFNSSMLGHGSQLCYNQMATFGGQNLRCSYFIFHSTDLEYCDQIYNSEYLFGCVGLKHKKHCILNKQYSEEDFDVMRSKLVDHMKSTGEWGQFLPKEMCCFGYNEGTAHQYYPLTKEQAIAEGFKWKDEDQKDYQPQSYVIPDDISEVQGDIIDQILACVDCKKNYKIIPQELKFYRTHNLPIPCKCSECRHTERMDLRNPKKLYDRKCDKCGIDVQTTYSPDRPEKVYCEECYLKTVY